MEPSEYANTISAKKFIVAVSMLVFALNCAKIKEVRLIVHGIKDLCIDAHSFPPFITRKIEKIKLDVDSFLSKKSK